MEALPTGGRDIHHPASPTLATALSVLGPLEIRRPGDLTRPGAARQRRILTVLAVAAFEGRAVSSDELLEGVYGDAFTPRARRALSTELWRCRQLLGNDAIASEADGYAIDLRVVDVDVVAFGHGLAAGRIALEDGAPDEAVKRLTAALGLWRGSPLPDWRDHPTGAATAARLEEMRVGATEDLAEAMAAQGRHKDAIAVLLPVTREHPTREHAWSLLIEAHLMLGDRRRARTALDSARRELAEHGVDLGSELRAVRDRLQVGARAQPPVRAVTADDGNRFVGRAPQVAVVTDALVRSLRTSAPGAVVITGEAGIGKTTLAERAAATAVESGAAAVVRRIRCDRRLGLPYAALAPLLTELEATDALDGPPEGLSARIVDVMEAAAQRDGMVLVVEDLHWATPELVDVVLLLLAHGAPVPLALAVTLREPVTASGALLKSVAELRRRAEQVVWLSGLDADDTRQLLGPGFDDAQAASAHRLTGGNPLYLRHLTLRPDGELVAATSLAEALDEHIDMLPVEVVSVLEVAAAIGTTFDARVLTSAVAHPPLRVGPTEVDEGLRAATDAGLITVVGPEPHDLAFVHALLRDRLYRRAPASDRTTAHALVVRALDRLTGSHRPSADLLAHHCRRGWPVCPTAEVVARLTSAAEVASQQGGFAEATRYFRQALDVIAMDPEYGDHDAITRVLTLSGRASITSADLPAARASYTSLQEHARRIGSALELVRGALGVVRTYATQRIDEPALETLVEALEELLDTPVAPRTDERSLIADAIGAVHVYRPATARALRERAGQRDAGARAALLTVGWEQEPVVTGLAIARELVATPDADPLASAVRLWASEVAAGERTLLDEPSGIWALEGSEPARWEARVWQVTVAMSRGEFARARRLLDDAEGSVGQRHSALETPSRMAHLLGQRMWIAFQTHDIDELVRVTELNRPTYTARRPIMRVVGALREIMLGDRDAARTYVDDLIEEFIAGVVPSRELHASVVGLLNACIRLEHDRGIRLCRDLLTPSLGEHVLFYLVQYWGSIHYHVGKCAAYADDYDAALHHLRISADEHAAMGAHVLEAQNRRLIASTLWHRNGAGDRAEATDQLALATRLGARLGMRGVVERAWPPPRAFHVD